MALLPLSILLVVFVSSVYAQVYTAGICPIYQTSQYFDNTKIGKVTEHQGYTAVMSYGIDADNRRKCQRLRLLDRSKYVLSYIDESDNIIRIEGAYDAVSSGYTSPGYLELRGGTSGVMGADIFGNTRLYPLMIGGEIDVYIACTSYGLYYSENVYVLSPYFTDSTTKNLDHLQIFMTEYNVPFADKLKGVDQTCDVPGAVFNDPEAQAAAAAVAAAVAAAQAEAAAAAADEAEAAAATEAEAAAVAEADAAAAVEAAAAAEAEATAAAEAAVVAAAAAAEAAVAETETGSAAETEADSAAETEADSAAETGPV